MDDKYKLRLQTLWKLYDIGKNISLIEGNGMATTLRAAQAEKVVEKVLLHCGSIVNLLNIGNENYAELDIALVASAARNIIDSANIYFYVSEGAIEALLLICNDLRIETADMENLVQGYNFDEINERSTGLESLIKEQKLEVEKQEEKLIIQ